MPRQRVVTPLLLTILLVWVLGVSVRVVAAKTETVTLPITIDYNLLQALILRTAYTEKDQSVTLLNSDNGCLSLILSHPTVSESHGFIQFETEVEVHAGSPIGDNCMVPVGWKGYLVLYQRPVINSVTWQLSFVTTGSKLLEMNRQPAQIAGVVWDLVKEHVFQYLESIKIDLAPPVNDLKTFLLPLFPEKVQQQTKEMLATLRTGEVRVTQEAVTVDLLADVQEVYRPEESPGKEVLSGRDLEETVHLWEQWDALLSYMVTTVSQDVLTEDERQTLMDVLLDARYRFVEGLNDKNLTNDFVREQFVKAWKQLSPIFRNHMRQRDKDATLGYLSFFTAADALTVLDRLGPTFGIEMSRDGLIRLARMLTTDQTVLIYGSGVNPALRRLFQLKPDLQIEEKTLPTDGKMEIEEKTLPTDGKMEKNGDKMQPDGKSPAKKGGKPSDSKVEKQEQSQTSFISQDMVARIRDYFFPLAYAGDLEKNDILQWRVPKNGLEEYVKKVIGVLDVAANLQKDKHDFPPSLRAMYRSMIIAMAWQESCFRQFVEKNNQLFYLLSYNNTSVGLMQVNERVWRGLYNLQRLRWDISYNAAAGSEIAALYLQRYALRDKNRAKSLDQSTLACLVYAMYNGGPGQYYEFLKRLKKGRMLTIDTLFNQKYSWVVSNNLERIAKCLIGD